MLLTGKSILDILDDQLDYLEARNYRPTLITMNQATLNQLVEELKPFAVETNPHVADRSMEYRGISLRVKASMNYRQIAVSSVDRSSTV
jgi:hypothetical protein